MADERLLRMVDVCEITGLSRATIYRYIRNETFPKQISLGLRRVGWRDSQIVEWMDGLDGPDDQTTDSFTKVARKLADGTLKGEIILGGHRRVRILRTDERVVIERKEKSE